MGLLWMAAFFVFGGVLLLRGSGLKQPGRWRKLFFSLLAGIGLIFLIWLAVMVFAVGPSMREFRAEARDPATPALR